MNGPHARARTRLENRRHRHHRHQRQCHQHHNQLREEQQQQQQQQQRYHRLSSDFSTDGFRCGSTRSSSPSNDHTTTPSGSCQIPESISSYSYDNKNGLVRGLEHRRITSLHYNQPQRYQRRSIKITNSNNINCNSVRSHRITNAFLVIAAAAVSILAHTHPVSGSSSSEPTVTSSAGLGPVSTRSGLPVRGAATPDVGGPVNGGGIDLLTILQLHNTTRQGVNRVQGLVTIRPAYYLQGNDRELRVSEAGFQKAAAVLRQVPEFTVAAALRQEENNSGTIIAFSHGNSRYLELQSSGRRDELRLHYISRRDGDVYVEAFPYRLADGAWHRVALSISGSQVELLVDCHPLYRRLLRPGPPDTNFTLPQLQLWIGQRNAKHSLFKGALQDVKLIPGPHGYLSQCPQLDSSCPTCGQFSMLQNTVEQLMQNLNELTQRLSAAEGRISKVEECECQKSCRINGTVREDGAVWEKNCEQCACVHGETKCKPVSCMPVNCTYPYIPEGECCPKCRKECFHRNNTYEHGVSYRPKPCSICFCSDGSMTCNMTSAAEVCPQLLCAPSEQISVADECCKFCPGVDYCAKNSNCHINASCLNLQTTYACHCNVGYQGDGNNCHDVDECKHQGEGHHCNANTICVNSIGSYVCECRSGYHRVDKFNCAELDECSTGRHKCDEHATCINTAGSYECKCLEGYAGDGYTCKPVCKRACQNGGECIAPEQCSCRRGYTGASCELDLDECASDLHRCHHSSTCFNMQGWYYCRCKPGYHSALHDTTQGTQCQDIDECVAEPTTGNKRNTCHPSALCVNTVGAYECACPPERGPKCKLSCMFEDKEVANGETVVPLGYPCRRCSCRDGVISCKDPTCNCSIASSQRDKCCPQCDPSASCKHQDLHHLVFRSGERWIYQCQTCECLNGEIDCWQMECPPAPCTNPVAEDGDCCPRCEDDPCAREVNLANNGSSLISSHPRPCSYGGMIHESSSSWQDPHDKCTTCECKDGQLCCSYDYRCAGYDIGERSSQPHFAFMSDGLPGLSRSASFGGAPETALPTVPSAGSASGAAGSSSTQPAARQLGRVLSKKRAEDFPVITGSDIRVNKKSASGVFGGDNRAGKSAGVSVGSNIHNSDKNRNNNNNNDDNNNKNNNNNNNNGKKQETRQSAVRTSLRSFSAPGRFRKTQKFSRGTASSSSSATSAISATSQASNRGGAT